MVYIPFAFLVINHLGLIKAKVIYDAFWFCIFCFGGFLLFHIKVMVNKITFLLISILLAMLLITFTKYCILSPPKITGQYFQLVPFLKEYKVPFYISVVTLIVTLDKKMNIYDFEVAGQCFAILVILNFFICVLLYGLPIRPGLIDEANYDNLIILLAYVARIKRVGIKRDSYSAIIVLATFMSQSKTGLICLLILIVINLKQKELFKVLIPIIIIAGVSLLIISSRLQRSSVKSFDDVDRVRMLNSFVSVQKRATIQQTLIGYTPGYPLRMFDPNLAYFIKSQVESKGGVGLHAFNFHGMWFRLISSWGIFFVAIFISIFIYWGIKNKSRLSILLLVLLQGLPMGVFYLSTVGPLVMLFILMITLENKKKIQSLSVDSTP